MSDFIKRPQIEVLSAADGERRRQQTDDDKLRIVAESFIGHRHASATARRHNICRSLLTTWPRQYQNGELGFSGPVSFPRVSVLKEVSASQSNPINASPTPHCRVEVTLPNGRRVIVPIGVEAEALAQILAVMDRQ